MVASPVIKENMNVLNRMLECKPAKHMEFGNKNSNIFDFYSYLDIPSTLDISPDGGKRPVSLTGTLI